MQTQTETKPAKSSNYRKPPPKPRIAPGHGESPMLAVRIGADRLEKLKRLAESSGQTPAEFVRWLLDNIDNT